MSIVKSLLNPFLVVVAASCWLSGCAGDDIVTTQPKNATERSLSSAGVSTTEYEMTVGDRVRVTIFDLTAESTEYAVDDVGAIAVPPVGAISVKGKTTQQAASAIAAALSKAALYRNPRVTVDVLSFGPFYVLGEVNKPGEFIYRPGMSLFAALAMAGGQTYRANTGRVYIRRATDTIETEYKVTSDLVILPGDIIRVPELQL